MRRTALTLCFGLGLLTLVLILASANSSRASALNPKPENLVENGDFESDPAGWALHVDSGAGVSATLTHDTTTAGHGLASAQVTVIISSPTNYHVSFFQDGVPVISGTHYTFSFWARSSEPRRITNVTIQKATAPWTTYSGYLYADITPTWKQYDLSFVSKGTDPDAHLLFCLGDFAGDVWLDGIYLAPTPPTLVPSAATLKVGRAEDFSVVYGAAPYIWSSSDPAVGIITPTTGSATSFQALSAGATTVTVADAQGVTGTAIVSVIEHSQIVVKAESTIRPVPEQAFGSNAEYYNDEWQAVLTNATFLDAVRDLGVTSLRYPGGTFASYYDFTAGQGWIDWREGHENQFNYVGVDTDGFLGFAQATDVPHLMITANVYKRGNPTYDDWISPQVAANWVEYTNVTQGQRVEYWELGNEINDAATYPDLPLALYLSKIHEWSQAMKAVDPTIKIGAVADTPWLEGMGEAWNVPIIEQTADEIDFLIAHPYPDVSAYLNQDWPWGLLVHRSDGARASVRKDVTTSVSGSASVRISVHTASLADYGVSFFQAGIPMVTGTQYTLSFWARASVPRRITNVTVLKATEPWTPYSGYLSVDLTTDWQWYELPFVSTGTDPEAHLLFCLGDFVSDVWLDDVSLVVSPSGPELVRDGSFEGELGAFGDEAAQKTFAFLQATEGIANLRRQLDVYAPSTPIEIQASEWNLWYDSNIGVPGWTDVRIAETLYGGVLGTDLLWDMIGEGVDGANLWTLCGPPWASMEASPTASRHAQYYMMQMSARRSGEWLVESAVTCPTYHTGPLIQWGNVVADHVSNVPYLAVYATKSSDNHRLYLIITSKSPEPEQAVITLNDFVPRPLASVWQMTSADWSDLGIEPSYSTLINASPTFTYTFPARSVTSIVLISADAPLWSVYLPVVVRGYAPQ